MPRKQVKQKRKRAPRGPLPQFYKRFVDRAIKTVKAAGFSASPIEFRPTGTVVIAVGQFERSAEADEKNEWDEVK